MVGRNQASVLVRDQRSIQFHFIFCIFYIFLRLTCLWQQSPYIHNASQSHIHMEAQMSGRKNQM